MADADDMDEELLYVTGRSSKGAAAKKRRKADESDDEGAAAAAPASSKRSRTAYSDDEDGDMNPEERAKLEGMNELEREMYLFEKEEQAQRQRERQQVLAQGKGKDEQVRASRTRPRPHTGTDNAIGRIAAAHAEREAREKRKQKEQQQRARGRKAAQYEDDAASDAEEEEEDRSEAGGEDEEGDEARSEDDLAGLEADDELGAAGGQLGARAETYDEGVTYEEADEPASLEELRSIQLKRSDLEAWHNEPFFEEDVKGCVVRIVVTPQPGSAAASAGAAPTYLVVRVADVVTRNSYIFPKAPLRTRKWLHLDDLSSSGIFRQQMALVSNSEVSEGEYDKARQRGARGGKVITKGDVAAAAERLQHARTFKYDSALVKQLLQQRRASGKLVGRYAQIKAQLAHELIAAQQEGRPEEEVQKIKDDLEHLEQSERMRQEEEAQLLAAAAAAQAAEAEGGATAAAVTGKLKVSTALALVNLRNRNKNDFKAINAPPGSALARATAASGGTQNDVFSRRHTQSKVYWNTSRAGGGGADGGEGGPGGGQVGGGPDGQLRRSSSSAGEVAALSGSLKRLDPAELIKVLDLSVDLSRLPPPADPTAQLPKRLLGRRWLDSVAARQAHMADWSLISLDEYSTRSRQNGLVE